MLNSDEVIMSAIGSTGLAQTLLWPSGGRMMKRCTNPVRMRNNSARAKTSPVQERRPIETKLTMYVLSRAGIKQDPELLF